MLYTFLFCVSFVVFLSQFIKVVLREKVSNEDLAHLVCFSLMVPMTVSPLLHSSSIKIIGTTLALLCSLFFIFHFFSGGGRTRTVMHMGMSLGMAAMYLAHHNIYVRIVFGIFYLCFFLYYFKDLLTYFTLTKRVSTPLFHLQSKFSHFVTGLAMFAMFFWR